MWSRIAGASKASATWTKVRRASVIWRALAALLWNLTVVMAEQPAEAPLLLGWREFPVDCSRGELVVGGQTVLAAEVPNSGQGTGLVVWDGSIVLAKFVEHLERDSRQHGSKNAIRSGKVLELGCGTGIVGLAAAALGADKVYLTDLAYALENTRENVEKNEALKDRVEVFPLDWTAEIQDERAVGGQLTHILAADVIWIPELVVPFVNTLERLAKANANLQKILFAHQTRALRTDEMLWAELRSRGFEIIEISAEKYHPEFMSKRIKIYEFKSGSQNVCDAS